MMKLIAFRIKNFRSIVDTGWQSLSPDNITCLIGQNESGKTSVLDGLKVFYTGVISEDVLRSDLSLPEVSCRFSVPEGWLMKVTDNPGTELKELLSGLRHLELKRIWVADLSSVINVSGEISQYLNSLEDAWKLYLDDVTLKLEEELKLINNLESELSKLENQELEIKSKLGVSEVKIKAKGFRLFGRRTPEVVERQDSQFPGLKNQLNELRKNKETITEELLKKQRIKKAGDTRRKFQEKLTSLDDHYRELSVKLEDRHQRMTLLMRPIDDENDTEWKIVRNDYRKTCKERENLKSELDRHIALSGYLIEGIGDALAEQKVSERISSYKSQYNSEILGLKFFEFCPVFEMFEDFGSLLPNRIDMEDIISGNENVEGYKAARNFLTLAHLDYLFFQQPSSRILKQKIENLNNSLTVNFHDFWQQSVGRNNKISIEFELEHYNSSTGEKAGNPYLEFWIKDEGERLYPKQRSRGVRWFLSFYMELKASAALNKQMVLLVDEPGVSLHARAQEDVLKVFDDIKDKIQIIYTTHSPHLVEINKLHRVLAVQRDDLDNLKSTTRILDPLQLSSASPDTLTPLQSILGNPKVFEGFSPRRYNVIVNDTGSFYVMNAIIHVMGFKGKISVIPSTSVSAIPLLCNILMGWGMEFVVLLFENELENKIEDLLRKTIFKTENNSRELIIKMPDRFLNSEDLLSTLDFKNNVLKSREGITVQNSEYIREKDIPRNFTLSRFLANVKAGKITISDFDEETLENFKLVIEVFKVLK